MAISYYAFRALSFEYQLLVIWEVGSFLATRYEGEDTIHLYHLGSFFVEVYYNSVTNRIHRTRTFTSQVCLLDYAVYVSLEDLGL